MPMYDRVCVVCGRELIDCWEPVTPPEVQCVCGGGTKRVWLTTPPNVVNDDCDVIVRHGICEADGTPRRYTRKSDMRREAERRGLVNHVEHLGAQGSDKSKHTSRWV